MTYKNHQSAQLGIEQRGLLYTPTEMHGFLLLLLCFSSFLFFLSFLSFFLSFLSFFFFFFWGGGGGVDLGVTIIRTCAA